MSQQLSKVKSWELLAQQAHFRPVVMATLCSVSLRQLERFFAQTFQMTPKHWTRELRCSLARQLLAEGWSNKAVAIELAFSNPSHLCHEFKKLYGLQPRELGLPLRDQN